MWLVSGAERFRRDPELKQALLTLARHEHTRECLLLLEVDSGDAGTGGRPDRSAAAQTGTQGTGTREQDTARPRSAESGGARK